MQNALRIYEAEQQAAIAEQEKEHLAKQKKILLRMSPRFRTSLVSANHILELFKEGLYGEITPEMNRVIR
ncbi:MAG UNVERIFIED_CONTAM: hypothetical protein LVR29_14680 [Microcystis novacekii LVE1205-3]|jgi:hypothetical protein